MSAPALWIDEPEVESDFRRVASLTHPDAAKAVAFWENRPADGLVIGRDVPSRAIATLLSRVIVYEPVNDKTDLRVHLAGTVLRRRFSIDLRGKLMSELFSTSHFPVRFKTAMAAIEEGRPQYSSITHTHGEVASFRIELMQIPIFAADGVTPWLLTFVFYLS